MAATFFNASACRISVADKRGGSPDMKAISAKLP
jgi:hypothetical protein